jgi:hypothetical protein
MKRHLTFRASEPEQPMKPIRKLVSLLIAFTVLPAPPSYSTRSLQSLAENNDPQLIYDPALEGKWKHPDRDDHCFLVISGDAKKREYTLRYAAPAKHQDACRCQSNGTDMTEVGTFSGHLFQLGGGRFLDIVRPEGAVRDFGDCSSRAQVEGKTPTHSILKVWLDHKTLWLTDADCGCSCRDVEAEQNEVGTCEVGGTFVFTAPAEAIQAFIRKHATDEKVFRKGGDFRLRVGKPGDSR